LVSTTVSSLVAAFSEDTASTRAGLLAAAKI
jgi:hypothetical protein